jgi:hypothetical protein
VCVRGGDPSHRKRRPVKKLDNEPLIPEGCTKEEKEAEVPRSFSITFRQKVSNQEAEA